MRSLLKKAIIIFTLFFVIFGALSFMVYAEEEETEEKTEEVREPEEKDPAREEYVAEWAKSGGCEWCIDAEGTLIIKPLEETGVLASWMQFLTPWYKYRTQITKVIIEPGVQASTCEGMFYQMGNCTSIDLSGLDTTGVTSMYQMFYWCEKLTELDVTGLNTGSVFNMNSMFNCCKQLRALDVTHFNTSNVEDMGYMFSGCFNLEALDVTNFDTRNVNQMMYMFASCEKLTSLDVSNFDTSKSKSFTNMFAWCSGLKEIDISNFDSSSLVSTNSMFEGCSGLKELDVSVLDTSKVKQMNEMFAGCTGLTELDISNFSTAILRSMKTPFADDNGILWLKIPANFALHVQNKPQESHIPPEFQREYYRVSDGLFVKNGVIVPEVNSIEVYTVRYAIEYEGLEDVTHVYYKEDPVTLSDGTGLAQPSKAGKEFIGWDTDPSATTVVFEPGESVDFTKMSDTLGKTADDFASAAQIGVKLFPVWATRVELSYDPNGGSNGPDPESIIDTSNPKQFTISNVTPVRSGFEFLGWAREASATEPEYVAGDPITLTDDLTLFAVWKKKAEPTPDSPYVMPKTGIE